ncbi:MAG: NAD(P)/FAD-dependent oxidoreductase [Vicinamibacterales bacterium]
MIRCDALIVGGGPAGSTCARMLRKAGWDVVVADCGRFPRDKVCAGWLTPDVFRLLELEPAEYRSTGLTLQDITGFRTGVLGSRLLETRYPHIVSYAIRRCEFDEFLLRRANVRVLEGTRVALLRPTSDGWIVNDAIETPVVIGAGGHFCPVARHMRGGAETVRPVVAKEAEVRLKPLHAPRASEMPELFFCRDLEGYGWVVPKGDYLNVGIGRREGREFMTHVRGFISLLEATGDLPPGTRLTWRGHAYLASGTGSRPLVAQGTLLVGDAAGLAYPESGEGIRPAIESGRVAAETLIAAGGRYDLDALAPYAGALRRLYPPARQTPPLLRGTMAALGRVLLGSRVFTKHVMLDRWFLRRT